jgi:surface polysaccharide O-acyltransferase-like enzyme
MLRSVGRLTAPIAAFVALCMLVVGGYGVPTLLFVNNYLGPVTHQQGRWHFWFVEAIVQVLVLLVLLLAIGPVRRFDRRFPFLFPLLVLAAALVLREQWVVVRGYHNLRFQTHGVLWFFVLGWLVHRATTTWQRLLVTALCVLTLPGFFLRPERGWFIAAGIVLLVWWREVPMPRLLIRPIAAIAAASLAIYVSHFRVFPPLQRNLPIGLAYVVTVAAGVAIWSGWGLAARGARHVAATARGRRRPVPHPVVAVAVD